MISFWLRLLLWSYFPFLLGLCTLMGWLLFVLIQALITLTCLLSVAGPLILLFGVTLLQVLWSLFAMLRCPELEHGLELPLPMELLEPAYHLVTEIVQKQRLVPPHEIRLGADTVAHVYEEKGGRRILVLGGLALAALSQRALAGVMAHELAHFTAGDTRLSRRAASRGLTMAFLEYRFRSQPGTHFNPLVWLIRLYHVLFQWAYAADSRQREFAADRHQVKHAGKEEAAAALLYITLTQRLPWARLDNIIKSAVAANEPLERVFSEHLRRAETIGEDEWQEACQNELRKKTSAFDSHPGLRDRLKAMGISPKKALKLLAHDSSSPPAHSLFPHWEAIERLMTEQLVQIYREIYLAKREMAQIFLGRPVG